MKRIFHPIAKSIFSVLSLFLSGILCSAIVAELTDKNGRVHWNEIADKGTFYAIVVLIIISIIYNIFSASYEIGYRQKINSKFLEKFIKEKGLDVLADQVAEAIKNNDTAKLTNLMDMKELITKNLEAK